MSNMYMKIATEITDRIEHLFNDGQFKHKTSVSFDAFVNFVETEFPTLLEKEIDGIMPNSPLQIGCLSMCEPMINTFIDTNIRSLVENYVDIQYKNMGDTYKKVFVDTIVSNMVKDNSALMNDERYCSDMIDEMNKKICDNDYRKDIIINATFNVLENAKLFNSDMRIVYKKWYPTA